MFVYGKTMAWTHELLGILEAAGDGVGWTITVLILAAGMIGCILPILPGHLIILLGIISYRVMFGAEAGISWWSFVVVGALMAISQAFEMMSGAVGSKWFGGTRWGVIGALLGSIAGLFFLPFGLLLGPLIGAFAFEKLFSKQELRPAVVSGVGSVVGILAGMGFKVIIGMTMIGWFFADVFLIGKTN